MKKCQTVSLRFICHDRVSHTTLCMYSVYEIYIYIYIHTYTCSCEYMFIYKYIYCIDMYMHVSLHVRWGLLDFMSAVPPPSPPPPPPPPPSDLNCKRYSSVPAGPRQQASIARSQCSPPSKLRSRVFPAGLQLQARTRAQCSPARPEQQPLDQSSPRRTSTASARSQCSPPGLNHKESPQIYQIDRMPERMSEDMPDTYAQKECQRECRNICRN